MTLLNIGWGTVLASQSKMSISPRITRALKPRYSSQYFQRGYQQQLGRQTAQQQVYNPYIRYGSSLAWKVAQGLALGAGSAAALYYFGIPAAKHAISETAPVMAESARMQSTAWYGEGMGEGYHSNIKKYAAENALIQQKAYVDARRQYPLDTSTQTNEGFIPSYSNSIPQSTTKKATNIQLPYNVKIA